MTAKPAKALSDSAKKRSWVRRVAKRILSPVIHRFTRTARNEDPWKRVDYDVPMRYFGDGSRHDFAWYFEGESRVRAASLDELLDWLAECAYECDPELFHEDDHWQHPCTFERMRAGDCEDHALWAWRKLVELGYDASLVSGNHAGNGHVWVLFTRDGEEFLLEATAKERARMVRPLRDARGDYTPAFGVNRERRTFAFTGFMLDVHQRTAP